VIGYILIGQNHLYVKMLFNRDSTIQKCLRRLCNVCKLKNSVPCQPSGRRVIPSGRPAVQSSSRPEDVSYRPDAHQSKASFVRTTWISVQTFLCIEKLRTAPACICLDDSVARPDHSQCSNKLQIFFPSSNKGRLNQPSRRRGFSSGRAHP
jgi:hypothetical protein